MDRVPLEAVNAAKDVLINPPHTHTRAQSKRILSALKKDIIVPIFKKGDSQECKNYQRISLFSTIGKVFMKIIQTRLLMLRKHREQTSREEQSGFHPHHGCDQIISLHQLMEEHMWCTKRLVVAFINFKSAFDCAHWPSLWTALEVEHVLLKIIHFLQQSNSGSASSVRIRNETSKEFSIQTGVLQGDVVFPNLFKTVIDSVLRKAFKDKRGVQYGIDR